MSRQVISAAALLAALAAPAAALAGAPATGGLEDVQIGERGDRVRIAFICRARCEIERAAGEGFRIRNVASTLDVDLTGRSALIDYLRVTPEGGGSLVRIGADAPLVSSRIIDCASDTGPAPCLDLQFAPRGAPTEPPFLGAAVIASRPALREETGRELLAFPKFAPPERLAPPARALGLDSANGEGRVAIGTPEFAPPTAREAFRPAFNLQSEAARLLGKSLDVGACEGAGARLAADAWALSAMIDVALCKAAKGDLASADADLARLLDYTPDNYEALVARALVAQAETRNEDAHALFQRALDAAPPIAQSEMIVEAMDQL